MTGLLVPRDHFKTIAQNWESFGEVDPFFGVLSDPTKYGGQWGLDEFFASGEAHVAKLMRTLSGLNVSVPPGSCLDFGCGVGRLTLPLSKSFDRTVGLDVARSMIKVARREAHRGHHCDFIVNRAPHLGRFRDETFDFVHSCLVLQHNPPSVSLGYIGEFLRVCRPGGLVVFQLPAEAYSEQEISDRYALAAAAYAARLILTDPPATLSASETIAVRVAVTNKGPVAWRHDIPAGRHITIANHWLRVDHTMAVPDDGRAHLRRTLEPGESCEVELTVHAPVDPGDYVLEVDLVQERVCWFAEAGSQTARARISVRPTSQSGEAVAAESRHPVSQAERLSWLRRIVRSWRGGTPTFEMHVVPRSEVERTVRDAGGAVLHAIDDGAAGYRWLSYTYICSR